MFQSIINDIKMQFKTGNMVTRLILINVFVFVLVRLIVAFTGHITLSADPHTHPLLNWLMMPSGIFDIIKKPWTLITNMFLHVGFWHIIWNMLIFYWFARIVGDFLGDRRVLPLYIMGGLAGVVVFLVADHFLPIGTDGHSRILGASASIMAFVFAAATLSPNYEIRLLILGRVKIKYIAAFLLFLDLIGTTGLNWGGHFGHIGGALLGSVFVFHLRDGRDITQPIQNIFGYISDVFSGQPIEPKPKKKRSPIKVVYKNPKPKKSTSDKKPTFDYQTKLNAILDKIKKEGIENLTEAERSFLDSASKRD